MEILLKVVNEINWIVGILLSFIIWDWWMVMLVDFKNLDLNYFIEKQFLQLLFYEVLEYFK